MRRFFVLPLAVAFVVAISFAATITSTPTKPSTPKFSSSVSSVEWKPDKEIDDLTTLNFTSSFIVTRIENDITIIINNKGPVVITVTRVGVHKVTPVKKGYSADPTVFSLSPAITIADGETESLPTITYTSQTGANVHLWVYFTINGKEYHIGVNLHFR